MGSALRVGRVRGIVLAYTVNRLGTWIGYVALSVAVFDETHSAIAVAALLVFAQVLPAFLAPALVARVEASPRRSELSGLYFFEALTTAAIALLLSRFWLPAVLLLVALDGTAALAANALLRAALAHAARETVDAQHGGGGPADGERAERGDGRGEAAHDAERRANAELNVGFSLTFMLGPAIGGLLVATAGAPSALLLDALSFAVCGAALIRLRPHIETALGASVRARLRAALDHIRAVPGLRSLLTTEAVAVVFFASGAPIEVAYTKATLHTGDWGYGVLLAVWGLGTVGGSVVFARAAGESLRTFLAVGALAVGLAYVGFAIAPSLALAFPAALLGGAGNGVQWASLISSVQRLTPKQLHGRMMGAVESLAAISPAIGLVLGGVLVAATSPRGAFAVVGVGAAATALAFVSLFLRGLDLGDGAAQLPHGEQSARPEHAEQLERHETPASSRARGTAVLRRERR